MGLDGEGGEDRTATGGHGTAVGAAGTPSSPFAAAGLLPGTRVDHYVLQHELGRGGMGQVFLARDTKLDRQVAIKFVIVPGKAALARFMAEARVTARCTHPNIVVIHEIDEYQGMPYTVLEYVQGESVSARLRGGPLPPARVAAIMTQVARAIAAAHARGIIHRDLKPANILLGTDGTVKVVDFGIAKFVAHPELEVDGDTDGGGDDHRDLTAADELIGTLHYLAPEQVRRDAVDARVDLWGFGVTMFQMLAGQRPFHGLSRIEVIERLKDLDDPVISLGQVAPAVPRELVDIVDRCLQKRASERMPSATELLAALEALPPPSGAPVPDGESTERMRAQATIDATPPTRRQAMPRRKRRMLTAAALAAVLVLAVAVTWRLRRPPVVAPSAGPASPAAVTRVEALFGEIDRLERQGKTAEAARMYEAFLGEEREPGAVALAWLHQGDRQRARGEREAALDTYAGAYARAGDTELQRRALLAVGELYRGAWAWDRLAAVIDVLDRLPGAHASRGEALRQQLRLAVRDPLARAGAVRGPARELLAGRRADLAASSMLTADVDGDPRPEVLSLEGGELITRSGDGKTILARRAAPGLTELRCAGRDAAGAWVVAAPSVRAPTWRILDLAGGAPPASLDGLVQGPRGHCLWSDLDGDRRNELYIVVDHGLAQVTQEPAASLAAPWRVRVQRMGSQIGDLIGGDLDGDGRGELVIALGEWRAYDVRVVRGAAGGDLHVDDRVRLGVVTHLVSLGRGADGRALIGALKEDIYPSIRNLPADRPTGAADGFYVLALGPHGLEIVNRTDVPRPPGAGMIFRGLWAADLDGDGVRDAIASVGYGADGTDGDMVVMHGLAGGRFEVSLIGRVKPIGAVDSDADAASELLVYLDGAPLPWLLGDGDVAVPRVDVLPVPEQPPPAAARRDAGIAAAWRRAEELGRIGRVEAAVAALRRISTIAAEPQVRGAALRRASALLQARGLPAAEVLEAMGRLSPDGSRPRLDALLAAIEEHAARLEVTDARRLIDELGREGGLTAEERARLALLRGQLDVRSLALYGGDVLPPAWRVTDPALVHVVPGSGKLTVETLVPGVVAAVPLVRTGELITLLLDLEVTRTEWAGDVRVRLGPRDRTLPGEVVFEVTGQGGGGIYRRHHSCGFPGQLWDRSQPLPHTDAVDRVHVEVALRPARRRVRCELGIGDGAMESDIRDRAGAFADAAEWELSIEGGAFSSMTAANVRFASIVVGGFELAPGTPDPLDRAALALANHRPAEARAALAEAPRDRAATWAGRRLAAIAADEAGDHPTAIAAIGGASASIEELAALIRARDGQFAPVVRAALGGRVAPVLEAAWATVAHHDLDEARVRTALIRDLAALPAGGPATAAARADLDGYLGEALLEEGRPDDARRTLGEALAIYARLPAPAPELRDRAERVCHLLAVEAATRGDAGVARAWGVRAMEVASYPELAADQLLQHPATRALFADAAHAKLVALGRSLAEAPIAPR